MLIDFKKLNTMGVINVTPNSFSDPKKFFHSDELLQTIEQYKDRLDLIFDFGFESTAPMNSAITESEERARFDRFFEMIKDLDLSYRWISFDTYRPSNFRYFRQRFLSRYTGQGFLFNDVSGVIDDELIELLRELKTDPHFFYLYSFTHIPSRAETLKHMDFLREGDILTLAHDHFKMAESKFQEMRVNEKVVFDPCFGFSKSYEQNWELLKRFHELKKQFSDDRSWLIGISKKSFLRKSLPADTANHFIMAEKLHEQILSRMISENKGHVFYRVHDFDLVTRALENVHA